MKNKLINIAIIITVISIVGLIISIMWLGDVYNHEYEQAKALKIEFGGRDTSHEIEEYGMLIQSRIDILVDVLKAAFFLLALLFLTSLYLLLRRVMGGF